MSDEDKEIEEEEEDTNYDAEDDEVEAFSALAIHDVYFDANY